MARVRKLLYTLGDGNEAGTAGFPARLLPRGEKSDLSCRDIRSDPPFSVQGDLGPGAIHGMDSDIALCLPVVIRSGLMAKR